MQVLHNHSRLQSNVDPHLPRQRPFTVQALRAVKVVGESSIRDVIVDQNKASWIAAIAVEFDQVWVVNRREYQDFVAEALVGKGSTRGGAMVGLVEILHGHDPPIVELTQIH